MLEISKRIKVIIEHYKLSISEFESQIGVSSNSIGTAIRRNSEFKSDVLNKVLNQFKEINPVWLLTGKSNMILRNSEKFVDLNSKDIEKQWAILMGNSTWKLKFEAEAGKWAYLQAINYKEKEK